MCFVGLLNKYMEVVFLIDDVIVVKYGEFKILILMFIIGNIVSVLC